MSPQTLSLPKLKLLDAPQEDKAQIVKEYFLPSLEELILPSESFLKILPNKIDLKKLTYKHLTDDMIKIIATCTKLESLILPYKQQV